MSRLRYERAQFVGMDKIDGRLLTPTTEVEPRGGKKSRRTSRRVWR